MDIVNTSANKKEIYIYIYIKDSMSIYAIRKCFSYRKLEKYTFNVEYYSETLQKLGNRKSAS